MRIFAAVLAIALILLQGRLWLADKGLREVSGLKASVETQRAANLRAIRTQSAIERRSGEPQDRTHGTRRAGPQ